MARKALLMVDVQNDFCPGGALAVPNGDSVVEPLNQMVNYALQNGWLIIASRDWHPAVTKHFKPYGGIWPVHCVQGTNGAEFHPDLCVDQAVIISKATQPDEDGYSPFDGYTEGGVFFGGQTLEAYLRANKVTDLYVGGLATDYCVKAAALDAAKRGFKTHLLVDACRAVNLKLDDGDNAILEMTNAGVILTTTNLVLA